MVAKDTSCGSETYRPYLDIERIINVQSARSVNRGHDPKWLNVINELQKYVCRKNNLKPGDYTFYGTQIENDFIRKNLSILAEYGIPNSAIIKLENKISANLNEDYIFEEIKNNNLIEISNLNRYEKEKIIENL